MKRFIFLSTLLFSALSYAENNTGATKFVVGPKPLEQLVPQYLQPQAVVNAAYEDFKFSSHKGFLFNKYSGHTDYLALGGDNFNFGNYFAGFNVYNIKTDDNIWSRLNINLSNSSLDIENNGLYFHVMRQVFSPIPVFVDVFASYGQSKFKLANTIYNNSFYPIQGSSQYGGQNSLVGGRTFFGYGYGNFYLQGDVTYFYSNFHQRPYTIIYPNQNSIQNLAVPALTSRIGTFLENARLYYAVNEYFSPFLSAGLIQLASRNFSRPLVDANAVFSSPLPQLLIGRTGYRVGAGFNLTYKWLRIVPMYSYLNRSSHFKDNYTSITFELMGV
ncbi:hypothetical protein ACNVED_11965 [Legionella sp. D16C41]|uniref:hypothetical protein n=1 Tax=Legionella sp. D16C41 TaxID=3402688 RepID=UPI003AF5C00E